MLESDIPPYRLRYTDDAFMRIEVQVQKIECLMREYRDTPTEFHTPTPAELKARNKRNVALALGLAIFMIFVFVTMVSRGVIPSSVG